MISYDKKALSDMAAIFKALGHPARLWMVQRLAESECCVHELVESIGMDFSTVSQHLSVLKNAGILEDDKRGKHIYYRVVYPCIPWVINQMEARANATPEQVEAFTRLLNTLKP